MSSIRLTLFFTVLAGLGAKQHVNAGKSYVYRPGWTYKYAYDGHVTTYTKNLPAGIHVKTIVEFTFHQRKNNNDNILMRLVSPKITDLRGNSLTEADVHWTEPIRFERSIDGRIMKVFTKHSHPTDMLNVKRGIASLLQVTIGTAQKADTNFTREETDIGGRCQWKYEVRRLADRGQTDRGETWIAWKATKINKHQNCVYRAEKFYSPVELVNCNDRVKVNRYRGLTSPNTLTEIICRIHATGSNTFVKSCISTESQVINTASGSQKMTLKRSLTFLNESFNSDLDPLFDELTSDRKGLVFQFSDLEQVEFSTKMIYDKVYRLLESISQLSRMESADRELIHSDVPVQFVELVNTFRLIKGFDVFKSTFNTLYKNNKQFQFWLKGALPFINNEHAIVLIKEKILGKEIEGYNVVQILSRVGVTPRASVKMCDIVKEICNLPSVNSNDNWYSTCWLTYGSLVHTACRGDLSCLNRYATDLKSQYDRFASKNMEKFVVTLKTIGNAGIKTFLSKILKLLEERDRIRPPHPNMVIVSAIDALRRMNLGASENAKMQRTLKEVFADIKSCPEFRLNAFTQLMRTRPSRAQLLDIAKIIAREPKVHVRNFVFTYLGNMANNTCPREEATQARFILMTLAYQGEAAKFQPSFSRSLYFKTQVTNPIYQMQENVEIEKGYTPLSFIPRFVNIKSSTNVLGYKINGMEFHVRQEGLLPFLKNIFGPHGSLFRKRSIWDFFRQKRSDSSNRATEELKNINRKLNLRPYKDKPLRLCISSKLFGSEIEYLVLNRSHPLLGSALRNGTVRLDINWWENKLRLGMNWTKKAVDILFEGMYMVPTSIGLPLKMKLSVGGVLDVFMKQQITTNPVFSVLSWNNKPTKIEGLSSMRARFGVFAEGAIRMFYRKSSFGFTYQLNNSIFIPLQDEFKLDLEKQKFTEILQLPKKRKTLIKTRSAAYIEIATVGKGIDKRYASSFQHGNSEVKRDNSNVVNNLTTGTDNRSKSDGLSSDRVITTTHSSTEYSSGVFFRVVGWNTSSVDEPLKTIDAWSNPTSVPGYGLKFEFENKTASSIEQLYKVNVTFLGTSPPESYTARFQFKSPKPKPPGSSSSSGIQGDLPNQQQRTLGSKPIVTVDIANITVAHSNSEWKLCYIQKLDVGQNKSILNTRWGKQCKEYELNTTIWMTEEKGYPATDVIFSWNKTPPGVMQSLHMMACVIDPGMMKLPPGNKPLSQKGFFKSSKGEGSRKSSFNTSTDRPKPKPVQYPGPGDERPHSEASPYIGSHNPLLRLLPFHQLTNSPSGGLAMSLPISNSAGPSPLNMCSREMHLRFVLNGSQLEIKGISSKEQSFYSFAIPPQLRLAMKMKSQPIAMVKELQWSFFHVCRAQMSKNIFTTFDNRSFQYHMTTGCPHVLAKDASNQGFFAILLTKENATRFKVTVYIKSFEDDQRYHSFEISNTGAVSKEKQLLTAFQENKQVTFPRLCALTRSAGKTTLYCDAGFKVVVTSELAEVTVSPWHFKMNSGMCGYYDTRPSNDFYGPWGMENTGEAFGNSWLIPGDDCNGDCKRITRQNIGYLEEGGKRQKCTSVKLIPRCCSFVPLRTLFKKTKYYCGDNYRQQVDMKNMKKEALVEIDTEFPLECFVW